MSVFKEHAESLIEKGLSVTPVIDKRPYVKDWQNLHGESVLENAQAWEKANGLGLILGEISGIICLDIDIKNNNERLKEVLEGLNKLLPPLYCGLIGSPVKPIARLFKFNGERSEKFRSIDVELLSNGNQKVIPPSVYPGGLTKYVWRGKSLYEIDPDDLPELPEIVLEYLRQENERFRNDSGSSPKDLALTPEKGRSNHGSHNNISKRALTLLHAGWDFQNIVDDVLDMDKRINKDADSLYFLCPSRHDFRTKNARVNAMKFVGELIYRNVDKRYDNNDFFKKELANGFTWRDPDNEKARPIRQHISRKHFLLP